MNPIDKIKSVAKSDALSYTTLFFGKQTITFDNFEKKFELLKATNNEEVEEFVYYFQNLKAPNLLMRISISNNELALLLENCSYFKAELGESFRLSFLL